MKDEDILLRLRRQYSKDETVKLLNIEIGMLKSEISELKDKIQQLHDDRKRIDADEFFKLGKKDKQQYYVTSARFNKQVKLTEYFINLYHQVKSA